MYSLTGFGEMIADRVRLDAYAQAMRAAIKPGSIVLDIGAGTGIMSMLACQLGAKRVYAIEPSPAAELIHEAARDNGYADQIVVLRQRSTDLTLSERADVIVSDLRGVLPAFHRHFADIADARERLLAPEGRLIPQGDSLFAAVVTAEATFEKRRSAWESAPWGLSLRSALPRVDNSWQKHRARAEDVLSEPEPWAQLDYSTNTDLRLHGRGTSSIMRAGTAHGLLAWFDTLLIDEVGFSNGPGAPEAIYGQAFFPWPSAVALEAGDEVDFALRADPTGSDYTWTWTTAIRRRETLGGIAQRFRQSTFLSTPLSAAILRKRTASFVPLLSTNGALTLEGLTKMKAGMSLEQIARELHMAHPERLRSFAAALDFIADLSERHSS